MRHFVEHLQMMDFRICGVFCMECAFLCEPPKFISGSLSALSAMVNLELPHINVLTKCDLLQGDEEPSDDGTDPIENFLDGDVSSIIQNLKESESLPKKFVQLHEAMGALLEDYSLVSFVTLNPCL